MNKTLKMLNLLHLNKKIKPTYITWKTFNAKQTWIHLPKMLNLLKKINNTMLVSIKKKIKIQKFMLLNTTIKTTEVNTITKKASNAYYLKNTTYQSIYKSNKSNIATNNIRADINLNKNATLNISMEYYVYMLLMHIFNNLKKTKISIVTLPRKRTTYTVLKSPPADKKSREQFMKELFNVHVSIQQYIPIMKFINSIALSYTKTFMHSYKYNAFAENKI